MTQQDDMDRENLRRQIEEGQRRLNAWPGKNEDLANLLPTEGFCSLCYLAGRTEQPNHDLVILCPHPSALLVPYRWSNGRLRVGDLYMVDKSAFVDVVTAILEHYAGQHPETTGRWVRLHSAASELLEACVQALELLTGQREDRDEVRTALLEAIKAAEG